jgi:hypothetical protein
MVAVPLSAFVSTSDVSSKLSGGVQGRSWWSTRCVVSDRRVGKASIERKNKY